MSKLKLNKLSNELRAAGAKDAEMEPLLTLAQKLHRMPDRSPGVNFHPAALPRFPAHLLITGLGALAGLVVGGILVMLAQTSLPDGWLYPVKQLSEQAAVTLYPDYKTTVMMHRAQEVQALINQHKSPTTVLATLAAYNRDAEAYKSSTGSYAAFAYCKAELRQAENQADGQERQALQTTLADLPDDS